MLQDDLDTFLALAEEFQLTGLMGNSEERFGDSNKDNNSERTVDALAEKVQLPTY